MRYSFDHTYASQMANRNKLITALLVILVGLIVYGGVVMLFWEPGDAGSSSAASAVVSEFGQHLNVVSLLSPEASSTIAVEYGQYVTPELLLAWQKNPKSAPGRLTSSPWPDHIQVDSIDPQGEGYIVHGRIILMTSSNAAGGDNVGEIPVVIQLVRQNGKWLIVAYQEQKTSR